MTTEPRRTITPADRGTIMIRRGVISWPMLLGQPDDLRQYLLLYDELWVPWLKSSYPSRQDIRTWDLDEEHLASIAYLTDEGLLTEPPIDLDSATLRRDKITDALVRMHKKALVAANKTYPTAKRAALEGAAAHFNIDMALSRLITYVLWRDKGEIVYPVVFPFEHMELVPSHLAGTQKVLQIVLSKLPTPSENIPLEDFVAFKRDPDTNYKFAQFWHWTQKVAKQNAEPRELEEEIDWLTTDYLHHLNHLTKELDHQRIEVLFSMPGDVLEDLVKVRWGKLARRLFTLRRLQVSAHKDELKLPGSELAYLTEASRFASRKRR